VKINDKMRINWIQKWTPNRPYFVVRGRDVGMPWRVVLRKNDRPIKVVKTIRQAVDYCIRHDRKINPKILLFFVLCTLAMW
jgi:hypothetical protein